MLYLTTEATILSLPALGGRNLEAALRAHPAYQQVKSAWQGGFVTAGGFKSQARMLALKLAADLPPDDDYVGNWIRFAPATQEAGPVPQGIGANPITLWLPAPRRGDEAKHRALLNSYAASYRSNAALRKKIDAVPSIKQAVVLYERGRLSGSNAIFDHESPV